MPNNTLFTFTIAQSRIVLLLHGWEIKTLEVQGKSNIMIDES